jgi:hypothetical protein
LKPNPDVLEKGFGWAQRKNADLEVAIGIFVRLLPENQQAASIGIELSAIEGFSKGKLEPEEIGKLYRRSDFPREAVDRFLED